VRLAGLLWPAVVESRPAVRRPGHLEHPCGGLYALDSQARPERALGQVGPDDMLVDSDAVIAATDIAPADAALQ
jgi:hypothetical protein